MTKITHDRPSVPTTQSSEIHNQHEKQVAAKSSSANQVPNEQEKRIPLPSEVSSKKREIDAEGKAQQARLESQFLKNPIFDVVKKLANKKDPDQKKVEEMIKLLQNATTEEVNAVMKAAAKFPTVKRLVLEALLTLSGQTPPPALLAKILILQQAIISWDRHNDKEPEIRNIPEFLRQFR